MNTAITKILVLLFFSILAPFPVFGQDQVNATKEKERKNIFNLFSQEEVLEISIVTDIGKIITNKYSEEQTSAVFTVLNGKKAESVYNVSLRTRGKYRLKVCDFPPIKLKFDKSEFASEGLDTHESLKLVTHCKDFEDAEDLILKEYLAYKIYNIISHRSFRVQLARINWIDSKGHHEIGEQWGFIIENEKQMAKRLRAKVHDERAVTHQELNKQSAALTSYFQYMIGNPDWRMAPLQNLSIIKPKKEEEFLAIPYDFDFSGIVDAPYAVTEFALTSTKERIYLGQSEKEELKSIKELFKSKKKEIIAEIKSFEHLKGATRRATLKYIRSFYATLNYPLRDQAYYSKRRSQRK